MAQKPKSTAAPRIGAGRNAASRKITPPAGLIAGSDNKDVLIGFTTTQTLYMSVGATNILRNPDPIVQQQSNSLGTHVYDEMLDKDPHAAGLIQTRITAVMGLPREIQPGNEGDNAVRIADAVRMLFDRWYTFEPDASTQMLALVHGYRPAEIEYELWPDGLWGIKRLHDRDPESYVFDTDFRLRLRTLSKPVEGEELDPRKFITLAFQPRANNPYGVGLGRSLWWMSWIKRNGLKSWLVAVEKFGVPTLHFSHEPTLNAAQRAKLVEKGNKVMTETVLATSKDVDVKLLESRGGVSGHIDLMTYLDDQQSKRVLGQTMTADAKNTGLSSKQPAEASKVRTDILESDALWVGNFYTETVIRFLTEYNFGSDVPEEDYPYLLINAAPPEDTKSLADRDVILVKDLGLKVARSYFYEKYGIPQPDDGEELINDDMAEATQASMPPGLDPMGGLGPDGEPLDPTAPPPPKKGKKGAKPAAADAAKQKAMAKDKGQNADA